MKITVNYNTRSITCTIAKAGEFIDRTGSDFLPETVAYAVCRLFAHNPGMVSSYVRESYDMRFAKGSGRKMKRYDLRVPAGYLELEGGEAVIRFGVTPAGIEILSVSLDNRRVSGTAGAGQRRLRRGAA